MKKVFLMPMFGSLYNWTDKFIDQVQYLARYGWYFKIFTPNDIESVGNVEVIKMTIEEFNDLAEKHTGVRPTIEINERGIPSFHITDFIIYLGTILQDYTKGYDFWGHIGFDNVIGRLHVFFPDEVLEKADILSDDVMAHNGNFCLWRNEKRVNDIAFQFDYWKEVFTQQDCEGCKTPGKAHTLVCPDEIGMNQILPKLVDQGFRIITPQHFSPHSHDRLENHRPEPKLKITEGGALWELLEDVGHPQWEHARPYMGREIPYFHFQRTKRYPKII